MKGIVNNLITNPIAVFAIILGGIGYVIIAAFISGKWVWLNQKINSNTKKAKTLLKIGVGLCLISSIILAFIIPLTSTGKEANFKLQNPYLGEWEVESSPVEELPSASRIRFYISEENNIRAIIESPQGKELGYLSRIEWNHYNYCQAEGKLSTNKGSRLNFHSSLDKEINQIEIKCYTKEGEEIGEMKIKK